MHALAINNLQKKYPNGVVGLRGINLEVNQGDFFGLLGPNGAGKTTTIGIICSLVTKTSGIVSVFGHNIDINFQKAKACIGVVPQEVNFNPFEKASQIVINQAGYYGIPKKIAEEKAQFFFEKLGILDKYHHRALRLSGGMKRRLMIARALVNEPPLLILDEPTAGVDIELRHALWEFLRELNEKGTTIILTTHYLEEAEHLCKNVAIIDHGEIIENAQVKSLITRLNIQTLIFDVKHPLVNSPQLDPFVARLVDATTLEVKIHQAQTLNELFTIFAKLNIEITSMRNKTNRLEELFVHLINENKAKIL